jgi:hypothetical protein
MNPSEQIDQYIASHTDWRGQMLTRLRELAHEADPEIQEEWKWNSPVWSNSGAVCSASAFKKHVGMNFFQGAALEDPDRLFNSGLESKKSRSINFSEGDQMNETGIKELIRKAVEHNKSKS